MDGHYKQIRVPVLITTMTTQAPEMPVFTSTWPMPSLTGFIVTPCDHPCAGMSILPFERFGKPHSHSHSCHKILAICLLQRAAALSWQLICDGATCITTAGLGTPIRLIALQRITSVMGASATNFSSCTSRNIFHLCNSRPSVNTFQNEDPVSSQMQLK